MFKINTVNVWVEDQDEALAWYTGKLGLEVRVDVTVAELDGFRWLTVGPVDQPDVSIALSDSTGSQMLDPETLREIRALVAKGAIGGVYFETDDCRARYAELLARGVEFLGEPTRTAYGYDCGFRDPFGNHSRLVQLLPAGPAG